MPTSASIILSYFGDTVSPRELKAWSLNKSYKPGDPFSDFTLTMFSQLIAGLAARGYKWRDSAYENSDAGFQVGLQAIKRSLDRRIPVMIDTTTTAYGGHTLVVAGYSWPDQAVFAVDPNREAPGIRKISFAKLKEIWNSRSVGFDGRGLLIPAPKAASR